MLVTDSDVVKCSFCGKTQKQVKKLIAGPGVYICDECIGLCTEIVEEDQAADIVTDGSTVTLPRAVVMSVARVLDQAAGAIGNANARVADDAARWAARLHDQFREPPATDPPPVHDDLP